MGINTEDRIEGVSVRERVLKIESEISSHLENEKKKGCTRKTKEAAHLDLLAPVRIENIQMAYLHIDTLVHAMDLPKEIMEKIFIGFSVKLLMTFKCVSKEWNDFISDDSFRRRYRSEQQSKGNSPTGLICGEDIDDPLAFKYGFCVASKFLYTSKNYVEREELESFDYLNTSRRYVLASSKGLLLLGNNLETLYVYDLVSKKHINLPRNNLEAGDCLSLGFKCEERGANHHPHLFFKVVCVDTRSACSYGKFGNSYVVEIYSSETGMWQNSTMKSDIDFHIGSHLIAKVIRGVFYWHDSFMKCFIAYDSEDPKGHIVLIKHPPMSKYALDREKLRQLEGTKDGSLQFIIIDKMVINVWILTSASGRSYMDEDIVCASKWSLTSSVSLWDIVVDFGNFSSYYQNKVRIILADPVDPHIIYFEFANKFYAYNYHQGKVVFTLFQQVTRRIDVFVPFEWPTWPCL